MAIYRLLVFEGSRCTEPQMIFADDDERAKDLAEWIVWQRSDGDNAELWRGFTKLFSIECAAALSAERANAGSRSRPRA